MPYDSTRRFLLKVSIAAVFFVPTISLFAQPALNSMSAPIGRLKADIERITKSVSATWGVYIKCIETGEEITINADRQMDTMSVIKIPLLAEVFEQVKEGKFKLTDKYTLVAEDVRPGSGVLRSLDAGDTFTVKDLVTLMIIVSDNTATDVLFRLVGGPEAVTRRMRTYGLMQTTASGSSATWFAAMRAAASRDEFHRVAKIPYGLSTPREIGTLFERMEKGMLVDAESSKLMLQILRGQVYRSRLPRFLSGWTVPHKTGDFMPFIANDAGVLERDGCTVIIVVLNANHFGLGDSLDEAVGRIAECTANYFGYRQ